MTSILERPMVMIDLETLGLKPGDAILSIGAALHRISDEPGTMMETLSVRVDLASCVMAGMRIDPETVEWWRSQSADAKLSVAGSGEVCSIDHALGRLDQFFLNTAVKYGSLLEGEPLLVVANGPVADVAWTEAACAVVCRKPPWSHRDVRCHRTLRDMLWPHEDERPPLPEELTRELVAHDALGDAVRQATELQWLRQKSSMRQFGWTGGPGRHRDTKPEEENLP